MENNGTLNERIKRIEQALETSGLWDSTSTALRALEDSEGLVHHEIVLTVEDLRASIDDLDQQVATVRARIERLEEELRRSPLD